MGSIFTQAFAWLKSLAIVSFGIKALKHLWPFLLIFIFWPEIDAGMSNIFPFWGQYVSSVTGVVNNGAFYLRKLPFIEPIFSWVAQFAKAAWTRIVTAF